MHNNHVYRYLSTFNKTDSYRIMLCHRPDTFIYADAYMWNVGLILSGHVHGEQLFFLMARGCMPLSRDGFLSMIMVYIG